jgi:hypothetical protein
MKMAIVFIKIVSEFFFLTEPYSKRKYPIWNSRIKPTVTN